MTRLIYSPIFFHVTDLPPNYTCTNDTQWIVNKNLPLLKMKGCSSLSNEKKLDYNYCHKAQLMGQFGRKSLILIWLTSPCLDPTQGEPCIGELDFS